MAVREWQPGDPETPMAEPGEAPPPPPQPVPLAPPQGTSPTTFWESSGAKVAVGATLAFGLMFVKAAILQVPVNRELVAAATEGLAWTWALAFGIQRADTSSLRWR